MIKFNKYYPDEFKKLRNAGRISSKCLDYIEDKIKPGITTQDIDEMCVKFLKKHNAYSAPLFYRGFQNLFALLLIMLFVTVYPLTKL